MILLLFVFKAGYAQDLFSLKLKVEEAAYARGVQPLLKQAVAIELVKLTGNPKIDPAVMGYFVKRPMRWIRRYFFTPYMQQGVKMGYWLNLEFDKQPLLKALSHQNLTFWPASARPAILLSAIWAAYGNQLQVTQAQLREHPDLDFRYVGQLFGVPIKLPEAGDETAFLPVLGEEDVETLNQHYGTDGVMQGYFEEHFINQHRTVSVDWVLMMPSWSLQQRGTDQGGTPLMALGAVMSRLLPELRGYYLEEQDIETELKVVVMHPQVEQLLALEKKLASGQPLVRSVFLKSASSKSAVFIVHYQGSGEQFHQWLVKHVPGVSVQIEEIAVKPIVSSTEGDAQP